MTLTLVFSFFLFIALTLLAVRKLESQPIRVNREEVRDASSDLS